MADGTVINQNIVMRLEYRLADLESNLKYYQERIKILDNWLGVLTEKQSCEDEEIKDIYNEDGSINECVCLCPNCHKHSIYDSEYGVRFNHCHECGQRLDWSEW